MNQNKKFDSQADEWKEYKLGDLFEFKNGVNADKGSYGKGVKFINISEVLKYNSLTADRIPGQVHIDKDKISLYKVKRGDILFNRTSEVAEEIAMASVYMDDEEVVFGGFVIRGRNTTKLINENFSKYLFSSKKFRKQAISKAQGAVRANIGQENLGNIVIDLPPIKEQEKIAEILSTWDEAIGLLENKVDFFSKKKKKYLGDLYKSEGDLRRISDICNIVYGKSPKEVINENGKNFVWGTGGVSGKSDAINFTAPVILLGRKGTINKPILITEDCWIIDTAYGVKSKQIDVDLNWLYYLFCSIDLMKFNESSGVPSLGRDNLYSHKVYVPDLKKQKNIGALLSSVDKELKLLKQKIKLVSQQKHGLAQQLLTGKRRVKV